MTIAQLIDRLFRDYLNRPDDRGLDVRLNGAVTDAATSIVLRFDELTPEEQALIGSGTILELDTELVRVVSVDELTSTVTVRRAIDGTTAASHDDDSLVRVAPDYLRATAFDFIADSIRELYPDLYTETVERTWVEEFIPVETVGAVDVLAAHSESAGSQIPGVVLRGRTDLSDSGIVFHVQPWHPSWNSQDAILRVKVRPVRPTATSDTLTALNASDDWADIIVVSAVAKMLPGREIDRTTLEYLTEALEAQGIELGAQFNLAASMLSLREALIQRQQNAQNVDQGMRVEYDRVI